MMHMRVHTGEMSFQCKYCNKDFSNDSYLSIHKMEHSGEKPNQCTNFGKAFPKKNDLLNPKCSIYDESFSHVSDFMMQ